MLGSVVQYSLRMLVLPGFNEKRRNRTGRVDGEACDAPINSLITGSFGRRLERFGDVQLSISVSTCTGLSALKTQKAGR